MGFFKRIYEYFFGSKSVPKEDYAGPQQQVSIKTNPAEPIRVKKPQYQKVPRTRETAQFVQQMLTKANSPDPKIRPHVDKTDIAQIEKLTIKIKENVSRKI